MDSRVLALSAIMFSYSALSTTIEAKSDSERKSDPIPREDVLSLPLQPYILPKEDELTVRYESFLIIPRNRK